MRIQFRQSGCFVPIVITEMGRENRIKMSKNRSLDGRQVRTMLLTAAVLMAISRFAVGKGNQ